MFSFLLSIAQAAIDTTIKDQADAFGEKLKDPAELNSLISQWLGWWMGLVGILTFLVILYSAVLFMSAGANEANAQKAKKFLIWGIVGAIVLVLSISVVSIAKNLLGG